MSNDNNALLDNNGTDKLMKVIASGNYSEEDILSLTNKKDAVNNQLKLFLLAQAKKELMRVLTLTSFLDKIENAYQQRVMENIDTLPLKDFPTIISTIIACLSRSNNIIQKVLGDETLSQLIVIDNSNNKTVTNTFGVSNQLHLDSPDSRDRVNKVVKNILNVVDNNMNNYNTQDGEE